MGCLLWVQTLIYILYQSLKWCMKYHVILYHVITTPDCSFISKQNQMLLTWEVSSITIFTHDDVEFSVIRDVMTFTWRHCIDAVQNCAPLINEIPQHWNSNRILMKFPSLCALEVISPFPVQPTMKISPKWQHFRFLERVLLWITREVGSWSG